MINVKQMLAELKKKLSEMPLAKRYEYARNAGFAVNDKMRIDRDDCRGGQNHRTDGYMSRMEECDGE